MDNRIRHIDGYTTEMELRWLYDTALLLPANSIIVELGAWMGRSSAALYKAAEPDMTVVSIDTWLGQPSMRDDEQKKVKVMDVFLKFMSNMAALDVLPRWFTIPNIGAGPYYLRMDSVEAAALFEDESIALLFVDDDHERCEEVCHAWIPKVKHRGIVSGHDYSEHFTWVREAVDRRFPQHSLVDSLWSAPKIIEHMDEGG